ncbi:hypothetical protein [Marivita cryptomonadis]|uniref:hypothetical protein n=1 Tax=Marivita cryptomonadis TaxID=505252 RepID=UPI00391B6124
MPILWTPQLPNGAIWIDQRHVTVTATPWFGNSSPILAYMAGGARVGSAYERGSMTICSAHGNVLDYGVPPDIP